jgi:membrane-associated phospholipid phosphatase
MRKVTVVRSARSGRAGKLAGALVTGGATTVLISWAVGSLMQKDLIVRPSREIYERVRARRSPHLARRLEQTITGMGDYPVLAPFTVLVGGLVAYERRDWVPVPLLAGGLATEIYLQKLLKTLVKGTKPAEDDSVGPPGDFPSGGAARTVIAFGLLAHLLAERWNSPAERRAIWSIVLAVIAAQGGSRLYLGRHWPEDILGGWLFGWLIMRSLVRLAELAQSGEIGQPAS